MHTLDAYFEEEYLYFWCNFWSLIHSQHFLGNLRHNWNEWLDSFFTYNWRSDFWVIHLRYQLKKMKQDLNKSQRCAERFKKRWQRATQMYTKVWQRLHVQRRGEYCATRAHRLCAKTLIFHHAVIDQIKSRYEESQQERQKQALSRLICGAILKKYRFQRLAQQSFGFLPNDGKSMVDQSGIVVLACIPRRNMTQWQHVIRVMLKNSLSGMT